MLESLKRKPLVLIPIIMGSAIGLVCVLAWTAIQPINEKNDFVRKILKADMTLQNSIPNENILGVSGETSTRIYFQTKDPSTLVTTDYELNAKQYVHLNLPENNKMNPCWIFVDSPNVNILAGRIPALMETRITHNSPVYVQKFPTTLFTRAMSIGNSSFIFRGFESNMKAVDQVFYKGNPKTGNIQKENNISEKNKDAGLSTDGSFSYDEQSNRIIYTLYYRNQFICLDTNLNLVYKKETVGASDNPGI